MCGVLGICAPDRDVARLAHFGLHALQHRGQESAGIAVSDRGRLTVLREMGLVTQVFNEQKLSGLTGQLAIGHTRYSTTGSAQWSNAQPIVQHGTARTVALGHNGNLVNAGELRAELSAAGVKLGSSSDTELIAALIANDPAPLPEAVANVMGRLEGAYSVTALAEGKLVAFRDPHGFRPLVLGRLSDGLVVASETCALDLVGAEPEREIAHGEVVVIDADGVDARERFPLPTGALHLQFFYLARPTRLGVEVHGACANEATRRGGAGRGADLVLPIPDSGCSDPGSRATGIPFSEADQEPPIGRVHRARPGLRQRRLKFTRSPRWRESGLWSSTTRSSAGTRPGRSSRCSSTPVRARSTFGSRRHPSSGRASTASTSPTRTS
jgi:amidophosphoribosyltransferase